MISGINPFIIIIDKEGDVVEHVSANSIINTVVDLVEFYNRKYSDYAPHFALEWNDGHFKRVTDYHPNSIAAVSAREVKLKQLGYEDLTEDQKANIQLGRNLT